MKASSGDVLDFIKFVLMTSITPGITLNIMRANSLHEKKKLVSGAQPLQFAFLSWPFVVFWLPVLFIARERGEEKSTCPEYIA